MNGRNRVVITGLGVLAANGIGKEAFWNSLLAGESGIRPITHFDASDLAWRCAGEVKNFSAKDYIDSKFKIKRESRSSQLAAVAAQLALDDANLSRKNLEKSSPICIRIGSTLSGLDLVETHNRRLEARGLNKGLPYVSSCLHIRAASLISSLLAVPTQIGTISNSCPAGIDAIGAAVDVIRKGQCDIAIAGGTDAGVIPSVVTGLGYTGLLSTNNEFPETASRPFDVFRTGGYLGEGAGVVILENLNHAIERDHEIYAEVTGFDSSCDYPGMNRHGLEICMSNALENAGYMPKDISYINAHGASSILLDEAESKAINLVFGSSASTIPVSSIKGATGNTLAGAGVMQVVSTALSFKHSLIPHTTNLESPDRQCNINHVVGDALNIKLTNALVNSRGIGGVNSSLILKQLT